MGVQKHRHVTTSVNYKYDCLLDIKSRASQAKYYCNALEPRTSFLFLRVGRSFLSGHNLSIYQ